MSMVRTSLVLARRWFPGAAKRVQNALGVEVVAGPVSYHEDGMTTVHNSDFLVDPHFVNAYAAAKATGATGGYDLRWRTYVVCWAAQQGLALDGDFVECGTNRGHLASAVIEYTNFAEADRKFYLLDTYNGLVRSCSRKRSGSSAGKAGATPSATRR